MNEEPAAIVKADDMIGYIKDYLIDDPTVRIMFSRFDIPPEHIYEIPIYFMDLPVSAKTKDKVIYINLDFLRDGSFSRDIHYIVHEMCHYLQQHTNALTPFDFHDAVSYLESPSELEAFMYQTRFIKDFYGEKAAEDYIKHLLDFHEYQGKARKEKEDTLLGRD